MKYEKIGRVTSSSVLKCTGKDWDEWISILTKAGATYWTHQEIVAYLRKRYKKLGRWWEQGVTQGFEIALGRRQEGRTLKGDYSITATASLSVDTKQVWKVLTSPKGISIWLNPMSDFKLKVGAQYEREGGVFGEVRTMKAGERARLTWREEEWPKNSVLQIHLVPKPNNKSILAINHTGIKDGRLQEELRTHWKQAISDIKMLCSRKK